MSKIDTNQILIFQMICLKRRSIISLNLGDTMKIFQKRYSCL